MKFSAAMEFSLTSQMSVAALQISATVFHKDKQLLSFFLKSQNGLLGENSKVNIKVSN